MFDSNNSTVKILESWHTLLVTVPSLDKKKKIDLWNSAVSVYLNFC